MASPAKVLWAVNMIFGAAARPVEEHYAEAYTATLFDRSDYQLTRAVREALRKPRDYPITAQELRQLAGNFAKTPDEEDERIRREQLKRVAIPSATEEQNAETRKGMLEDCDKLIAEGGDPKHIEFYQTLKANLLRQRSGNPLAELVK